jgi:photosystem II stability/assembly factor-like uncharacterized protein
MIMKPLKLWWLAAIGIAVTVPDQAQTWTSAMPSHHWVSVTSSADGSKLAVAAANGPIYLSLNSGASWEQANVPVTNYWSAVAISTNGSILTAVAINGPIYISTNSGNTWARANVPSTNWVSVALSADGTRMLASATNGPIYLSSDSGQTWTKAQVSLTLAGGSIKPSWGAAASSADGSRLMVLNQQNGANCTALSTDSGMTWTNVGQDIVQNAITCSADGKKVFVNDGGAIIAWTNGLDTAGSGFYYNTIYTAIGLWPFTLTAIASSTDGNHLVVATSIGKICTSTNAGAAWTLTAAPGGDWTSVASSADGSRLVAVSSDGNIIVSGLIGTIPPPALSIATSGGNSILSWPVSPSNYALQQNSSLVTSNWTNVPIAPTLMNQVAAPIAGGSLFYRLKAD